MKKLILSLALVTATFSFAQKQDPAALNKSIQDANQAAVNAYNSKNYSVAADKFVETYTLLKQAGTDDKSLMMNAALAYGNAGNNDKAISVINDLLNSNYTGVQTIYTAKNVKTGQVENLNQKNWELFKKTKDYTDFKTETTKSVEKELYQINARNLLNAKKYDEAIALSAKGLAKFPNDETLLNLQGLSYYNSGKSADFVNVLKQQLATNPKDITAWTNLAVMQRKDPAMQNDAVASYNKVLELDPNNKDAYEQLTYLAMGDDETLVNSYNAAIKAKKQTEAQSLLAQRRANFAKALPYAEKWYALDPDNADAVNLLKAFYTSGKNEAKAAEMKAKLEAMKK